MENVNTRFGFRSPWLDDDDPLYPCERVRSRDKRSCYLRASWRILDARRRRLREGRGGAALGSAMGPTCFRGFGRDAAEEARYDRDEDPLPLPARTARGEGDCLLGAARTIANASGTPGIEPAAALCERSAAAVRAACFSGVGLVLGMLHPTDASRRAACARLTPRYVDACARGSDRRGRPERPQRLGLVAR